MVSTLIKVKVTAHSRVNKVEKKSEDSYRIYVKEKAEAGKANDKAKELLARALGVEMGKLRLIRGHRQPNKLFELLQ